MREASITQTDAVLAKSSGLFRGKASRIVHLLTFPRSPRGLRHAHSRVCSHVRRMVSRASVRFSCGSDGLCYIEATA